MSLAFTHNVDGDLGTLIIKMEGIRIPYASYDPLGRIWSDVRKRIREWDSEGMNLDVVGLFTYQNEIISCGFCLNHAIAEKQNYDQEAYTQYFVESFGRQMAYFEMVLEKFVEEPLEVYRSLLLEGAKDEELEEFFRQFLSSIGVRTELDDRRSAQRAQRREKRKKNQKPAS